MKFLTYLLFTILGLIAFALIMALFISRQYTISVNETINKPKSEVYDYVKMLKNQEEYSVWIKADPKLVPEISGTDGDIGATQTWDSKIDDVGAGSQTIIAMTDSRIDVDLKFVRPMKGEAKAANILEAISENQTKITSEFYGDDSYPMNLVSYIFGRGMIKESEIKNLQNIKQILESK
ncbi:MAG: SRPBCC family protein [Saprospiraceae bacterium]